MENNTSTTENTPLQSDPNKHQHSPSIHTKLINDVKRYCTEITNHLCSHKIDYLSELKEILLISIATIFVQGLQKLIPIVSLAVAGHAGVTELGSIALASSSISFVCNCLVRGMSFAVTTMFGHLTGNDEYRHKLGTVAQRVVIIMFLISLTIISIFMNIEPIFLLLGQNRIISKLSAYYLLLWLPNIFQEMIIMLLNRYLLVQKQKMACVIISALGSVVYIISLFILLYVFKLSYIYSSVCHVASNLLMIIIFVCYIKLSKMYIPAWEGWQLKRAMTNWTPVIKMSALGIFMQLFPVAMNSISVICAGLLGNDDLAEFGLLNSIHRSFKFIFSGFGTGIGIRVARHLGANDLHRLRITLRLSVVVCITLMIFLFTIVMSLNNILPLIFTSSVYIRDRSASHMIYVAIRLINSTVGSISVHALLSGGGFLLSAVVSFIVNIVIGIPSGVILAFVAKMGIVGLLLGFVFKSFLRAVFYTILAVKMNWKDGTQLSEKFAKSKDNPLKSFKSSSEVSSLNDKSKQHTYLSMEKIAAILKVFFIGLVIAIFVTGIILRVTIFKNICLPREFETLVKNISMSESLVSVCYLH